MQVTGFDEDLGEAARLMAHDALAISDYIAEKICLFICMVLGGVFFILATIVFIISTSFSIKTMEKKGLYE